MQAWQVQERHLHASRLCSALQSAVDLPRCRMRAMVHKMCELRMAFMTPHSAGVSVSGQKQRQVCSL